MTVQIDVADLLNQVAAEADVIHAMTPDEAQWEPRSHWSEQYNQERMVAGMHERGFNPSDRRAQIRRFNEAVQHMHEADRVRLMNTGPTQNPFTRRLNG